ncbi:MAG TPA: protein-glutamate O-methyltransferase CheR [Rectinemataceae bacterium]|nr:protein-glutamate O-methyltransferase CheR [Rectinemataceae bacterium]
MQALSDEEFAVYARTIRELTGIALDASKAYLVESRLDSLVREMGLKGYSDLYYRIKGDASGSLARKVIDRITTQETSFFRDTSPFDMLKFKILPDLIDARRRVLPAGHRVPLRIWSAACSTGQEVYSILIALKEVLGDFSPYSIRLLATDISDSAIAKASRGHYLAGEIARGMPSGLLGRHFVAEGDGYRVRDEIRAYATFKRWNLFDDFSSFGRFDIVFCRNVAIYFTDEDKRGLFSRVEKVLEGDGALIVGSTESLLSTAPGLEAQRYLRSVYYRKKTA